MSNAPFFFGCLASLHFSAFALMCADRNIKRARVGAARGGWWAGRVSVAVGSGVEED